MPDTLAFEHYIISIKSEQIIMQANYERECKQCGEEFTTTRKLKVFCTEQCRSIVERQRKKRKKESMWKL